MTFVENILIGAKLSEYHTGYRAFSRELLQKLPLKVNSDDFVFDNQMLAQIVWLDYTIAEISCPTKYFYRSFINKSTKKYKIRLWVSEHSADIPSGENEFYYFRAVS